MAGVAENVAALAAAAASSAAGEETEAPAGEETEAAAAGQKVAGIAAGNVFGEVGALARVHGVSPKTFAALAGNGHLVSNVIADSSRDDGAGDLPSGATRPEEIGTLQGQEAEAAETVGLLAKLADNAGIDAPAIDGLLALVEGRLAPAEWLATITEPEPAHRSAAVRG